MIRAGTGELLALQGGYEILITLYMENVTDNSDWCKTVQILNCSQDLHSGNITDTQFPGFAKKRLRNNFARYWRERINDQSREKKVTMTYNRRSMTTDRVTSLNTYGKLMPIGID